MAVMKTNISWTDSTWNPTTGCTKVSEGCLHCYAEALTNRLMGGNFDVVREHPKRLNQVHGFSPLRLPDGTVRPRLVFVNSMSDLMHEDIAETFRDQVFDGMERKKDAIFQVLTKRPMTLKRYIGDRYKTRAVPPHIWLGVSVENNKVKTRIDQLRRLKVMVGDFTAFLSVEPLIGSPDQHDYRDIEQVLIGGESGGQARDMSPYWAVTARDLARQAGAAVWFKQWGKWANNPLYRDANAESHLERVRHAIAAGEREAAIIIDAKTGKERIVGEKGGATLCGDVLHELPPYYDKLLAALNAAPLLAP